MLHEGNLRPVRRERGARFTIQIVHARQDVRPPAVVLRDRRHSRMPGNQERTARAAGAMRCTLVVIHDERAHRARVAVGGAGAGVLRGLARKGEAAAAVAARDAEQSRSAVGVARAVLRRDARADGVVTAANLAAAALRVGGAPVVARAGRAHGSVRQLAIAERVILAVRVVAARRRGPSRIRTCSRARKRRTARSLVGRCVNPPSQSTKPVGFPSGPMRGIGFRHPRCPASAPSLPASEPPVELPPPPDDAPPVPMLPPDDVPPDDPPSPPELVMPPAPPLPAAPPVVVPPVAVEPPDEGLPPDVATPPDEPFGAIGVIVAAARRERREPQGREERRAPGRDGGSESHPQSSCERRTSAWRWQARRYPAISEDSCERGRRAFWHSVPRP